MIYLDNAATTLPDGQVLEAVDRAARESFANPSSLHGPGLGARKGLEGYRGRVLAASVGNSAGPWQLVFTSGGTESDALAVLGTAAVKHRGNVVTSAIEHPAVLDCGPRLERLGIEMRTVPPQRNGIVDPERVASAVDGETVLVSLMHVNNEIGTVQPVADTAHAAREQNPDVRFHCDAVQSLGAPGLEDALEVSDLITFSAHKIHGPRGVGALLVRKGVNLQPLTGGGGHEHGLRPGTENLPAAAGFAVAAELAAQHRKEAGRRMDSLRRQMWSQIREALPDARLNGDLDRSAPHILSVSVPGLTSQALVRALSDRAVCVSEGSACHSRGQKASHVLQAIRVTGKVGTVRFSLCLHTTGQDVDEAAGAYVEAVKTYRI